MSGEAAMRPELEPRMNEPTKTRELGICAKLHSTAGPFRFRLGIVDGVPEGVAALDGQAGPFVDCARKVLGQWRFTRDATGELTVGVEVTCTSP